MLQVVQELSNGKISILDLPFPAKANGKALIKTTKSIISGGTERMLVGFGRSNWIDKAKSQPEKVQMVLDKMSTDGIYATLNAVKSKLDNPIPLGYCNVGKVIDGSDIGFKKDTRVISNGFHAEVVSVPKNLICKIPDNVDDETAAFTVLGAISLQGIRLLNTSIGEKVVVYGLGVIGLLAVQILKANGCDVFGIDIDDKKIKIAESYGIRSANANDKTLLDQIDIFSCGGVDSVLITASSKEDQVIEQSAQMCRKRGKIVLVGVVGLNLKRDLFYEKEISFQVSCSYGPGRYDPNYEEKGIDYPIGYVRWTENRNFQTVLDLMSKGLIKVYDLIEHKYNIKDASDAYNKLLNENPLGILINYENNEEKFQKQKLLNRKKKISKKNKNEIISFLGGGSYASSTLMPNFKKAGASFRTLVSTGSVASYLAADKNNFQKISTNLDDLLEDDSSSVVIATRHDMHAPQIIQALKAQKNVFVEKPLALKLEEIKLIEEEYRKSSSILMVGFNRRFSPLVKVLKRELNKIDTPKSFIITVNAGMVPNDHWTQDLDMGGGRIVGEACHHIDLLRFLSGANISSFKVTKLGSDSKNIDNCIILLELDDGSIATINYFSNGGKKFPKERVEVFSNNSVIQIDNFKSLKSYGWKGLKDIKLLSQNKGQLESVKCFMNAVTNGLDSPIAFKDLLETSVDAINIADALKK